MSLSASGLDVVAHPQADVQVAAGVQRDAGAGALQDVVGGLRRCARAATRRAMPPEAAVAVAVAPPALLAAVVDARGWMLRSEPAPVALRLAPVPMRLVIVGLSVASATEMPMDRPADTATPVATASESALVSEPRWRWGHPTLTCAPSPMPALTVGVTLLVPPAPVTPPVRPPAAALALPSAFWSAHGPAPCSWRRSRPRR